jgi:dTDP-L-rhamnose 4-epimerase
MVTRILITGGAGFIGSHLAEQLLASGYSVRILDNLSSQVHPSGSWPDYLTADAERIRGDVRDANTVARALQGVEAVVHLAARVGVGQSMYEMTSYTDVNDVGTAVLIEALARNPIRRLVCASSMSIYGEGLARNAHNQLVNPEERNAEQLRRGEWELRGPEGETLEPLPTPEGKQPSLSSIYALNKYCQERLSLIAGRAYGVPTIAYRFFNVYGPNQALSNPYTGVLAIFAARLLNGRPPLGYEDGKQRRDFVHVKDVARACRMAIEADKDVIGVFNIGSGESRSILSVARDLAAVMGQPEITAHVLGKFRAGDIRHCFADISKAKTELGFAPEVDFADGLSELAEWLAGQVADDGIERATAELEQRGLVA